MDMEESVAVIGDILRLRYEIEQRLGEGPLFVTYRARDRVRNRQVALKLLRAEYSHLPELRIAVRMYADTMQQYRWPGVAACLGTDEHNGIPFLVFELASGTPLEERMKRLGSMNVQVAVDIAIGIATALDAPHRAGQAFGRLRPANVFANVEGSVMLTDFGLRSVAMAHPDTFRAEVAIAGPYMAPELFIGGEESPAADVYSVGVILFEMLTGERPVRVAAGTDAHIMPAVSMRTLNPAVPPALEMLVEKATSAQPSARHKDAVELLLDLKGIRDSLRFGRPSERTVFRAGATDLGPPPTATSAPRAAPGSEAAVRVAAPKPTPQPAPQPGPRPEPDVPRWLSLVNISLTLMAILVVMAGAAYLFLSVTKPREATVPALLGKTLVEARQILAERKLKLKVATQAYNDHFPPETIFATVPAAGEKVKEGATVAVSLSLGPRLVAVPDVRNLTEERARAALAEVGFKKVTVATREHSTEVPYGAVIRQIPQGGLELDPSQPVQLVISLGPEPTEPSEEGAVLRTWRIPIAIPPGVAQEVRVQVEFRDDTGSRIVYDAIRFAGEEFEVTVDGYGDRARVTVTLDGKRIYRRYMEPEP